MRRNMIGTPQKFGAYECGVKQRATQAGADATERFKAFNGSGRLYGFLFRWGSILHCEAPMKVCRLKRHPWELFGLLCPVAVASATALVLPFPAGMAIRGFAILFERH